MPIYCQNRNCPNKGKEIKEWFEIEFRKKLYRAHKGSKLKDVQVISENMKVCRDCK